MGLEIDNQIKDNLGTFYSIDHHLVVKKQLSPVSISNGLAWEHNDKIMYYIDSPTKKITAFDFDISNGTICKISFILSHLITYQRIIYLINLY
jgi:sugar lactone lactonase YvrE